jgi:creatinine amidohydrolase
MGADYFNAMGISEMISKRTGVIVAPGLPYGSHPYHHFGYAGTIPLRPSTQITLVRDIVKGFVNSGFNKVIIINAHGQWWVLSTALHEIVLDVNVFMAVATWQDIAQPTIKQVLETPTKHADESETSLALALYPEKTDMAKAVKETFEGIVSKKLYRYGTHGDTSAAFSGIDITGRIPEAKTLKYGVVGDATLATAEKGRRILEATADVVCALIEDLRARFKPGSLPRIKPELRVDM